MLIWDLLPYQHEGSHPAGVVQFEAGICLTCSFLSFSVMEGLEICLRRHGLWRVTITSAPVNNCFQMQRILFWETNLVFPLWFFFCPPPMKMFILGWIPRPSITNLTLWDTWTFSMKLTISSSKYSLLPWLRQGWEESSYSLYCPSCTTDLCNAAMNCKHSLLRHILDNRAKKLENGLKGCLLKFLEVSSAASVQEKSSSHLHFYSRGCSIQRTRAE